MSNPDPDFREEPDPYPEFFKEANFKSLRRTRLEYEHVARLHWELFFLMERFVFAHEELTRAVDAARADGHSWHDIGLIMATDEACARRLYDHASRPRRKPAPTGNAAP